MKRHCSIGCATPQCKKDFPASGQEASEVSTRFVYQVKGLGADLGWRLGVDERRRNILRKDTTDKPSGNRKSEGKSLIHGGFSSKDSIRTVANKKAQPFLFLGWAVF